MTDKPPRPRRWIPLSLRIFVAILLLIGVGSALPVAVRPYRQWAAIGEIELLGGVASATHVGPFWLRELLGSDGMAPFDEIWKVNLSSTPADDRTLRHLRCMTQLTELRLSNTKVTDAGLVSLTDLPKLRYLDLTGTNVTAAGVVKLEQRRPNLRVNWSLRVTD
jgi:hypothetical protein